MNNDNLNNNNDHDGSEPENVESASAVTEPENDPKDEIIPPAKKKLSKYEIFRRFMVVVCACVFAYFAVQLGITIYGYIEARFATSDALGNISDITRPEGSQSANASPIIRPTVSETPAESKPSTEKNPPADGETSADITDTDKETPPPETDPPKPQYSEYFLQWLEEIKKAKAKYPDFVGYINIEGLGIRYPVMQTDNNEYYLDHLIDGTYNKRGEIFADFRNDMDNILNNFNLVLYGHNLADGSKFNKLTDYKGAENFYNCPIELITEYGIYTFEVFSFYKTTEDNPYIQTQFNSASSFKNFCEKEQAASMHKKDFEFTGNEVIITLSTCVSYFGKRWCTHGVLVSITY